MQIQAYFLNPMRCEGKITREAEEGKILLCEQFSSNTAEDIRGVITKKFSGVCQKIPTAITEQVEIFEAGDYVRFIEDAIDLPEVEAKHVVSAFILQKEKILLLKRSEKVGTFQGFWATISGYIEGKEKAVSRARKEIFEEAGLKEARLLREGKEVLARTGKTIFVVHPFLFTTDESVSIDWEHTEYTWIFPEEIKNFKTVPKLAEALKRVMT